MHAGHPADSDRVHAGHGEHRLSKIWRRSSPAHCVVADAFSIDIVLNQIRGNKKVTQGPILNETLVTRGIVKKRTIIWKVEIR